MTLVKMDYDFTKDRVLSHEMFLIQSLNYLKLKTIDFYIDTIECYPYKCYPISTPTFRMLRVIQHHLPHSVCYVLSNLNSHTQYVKCYQISYPTLRMLSVI